MGRISSKGFSEHYAAPDAAVKAAGRPALESSWWPNCRCSIRAKPSLADDALGRIVYTPDLVAAPEAQAWFAELRENVKWQAQRRQMYDREVDVPRLTAHFRLQPRGPGHPGRDLQAARAGHREDRVPFNSVGLNFYRDGRDSVAPHNDHLDVLVEGHPIGLLSLGSTRRMTIRAKQPPRRVLHIDLDAGQPADDELRDPAPLHPRHPEDEGAGGRADQPGLSRQAGARTSATARKATLIAEPPPRRSERN